MGVTLVEALALEPSPRFETGGSCTELDQDLWFSVEGMDDLAQTNNTLSLDALEGALLRSFREGDGNWRFYFSGFELTAWGALSLVWNNVDFDSTDPYVYSVLRSFVGCELSRVELAENVLVLRFFGNTVTVRSDEDGEMVSLLRGGEDVADLWTSMDGALTHSTGLREPFDSLI